MKSRQLFQAAEKFRFVVGSNVCRFEEFGDFGERPTLLSCQPSPFFFASFQLGDGRAPLGPATVKIVDVRSRRLDVGGLITVERQAPRDCVKLLAALLFQMGNLCLLFAPVAVRLLASEDVLGQQHQRLFARLEQVLGKPRVAQTFPQLDLVRLQTLTSFE